MTPIDLENELVDFSLDAGRFITTANGVGVNVSSFIGKLKAMLNFGAGGGTTPTLDVKIQDSADSTDGSDGTWADVTGLTFTQVIDAASLQSIAIDTRAVRKWIRTVKTITGTSPTFDGAVTVVGQKQYK